MKERATVTSKGQITIPAPVRKALGLHQGDQVVFEISDPAADQPEARLRRAADFFALAGSIRPRTDVPSEWADERRLAREEQVRRRRR
jgi:AbrB family looped-hinge helix DNA binding protein